MPFVPHRTSFPRNVSLCVPRTPIRRSDEAIPHTSRHRPAPRNRCSNGPMRRRQPDTSQSEQIQPVDDLPPADEHHAQGHTDIGYTSIHRQKKTAMPPITPSRADMPRTGGRSNACARLFTRASRPQHSRPPLRHICVFTVLSRISRAARRQLRIARQRNPLTDEIGVAPGRPPEPRTQRPNAALRSRFWK